MSKILRLYGDRVAVKPIKETTTASGLVLPDSKERPQIGEVIEVGSDYKGSVSPFGQTVIYLKYAGTNFQLNGEDIIILDGRDILGEVGEEK